MKDIPLRFSPFWYEFFRIKKKKDLTKASIEKMKKELFSYDYLKSIWIKAQPYKQFS